MAREAAGLWGDLPRRQSSWDSWVRGMKTDGTGEPVLDTAVSGEDSLI